MSNKNIFCLAQKEISFPLLKFLGVTINVDFFDISAEMNGTIGPDDYVFVEKGHWCNGPIENSGEIEYDTDSIKVTECFFKLPALTRFLGKFVAADIFEWIGRKFTNKINGWVADAIYNEDPYQFDWTSSEW